jgi:hypothetical protein
VASVLDEIQTEDIPNTNLEYYLYNNLLRPFNITIEVKCRAPQVPPEYGSARGNLDPSRPT